MSNQGRDGGRAHGLSPDELNRLRGFRRAAAEIHASTVMRTTEKLGVSIMARGGESIQVVRDGPDPERFRSFAIALRRTYQRKDRANFKAARNVLARRAPELRPDLTHLLRAYEEALKVSQIDLGLPPQELFEAWLNGFVFHDDDPEKRGVWEALSKTRVQSAVAHMELETTAFGLAKVMLALDSLIADFLGDDRLPALPRLSPDGSTTAKPAEVTIQIRPYRRGMVWIDVVNRGPGVVSDVTLEAVIAHGRGDPEVFASGEVEQKLPRERLRAGERVSLMAVLDHDTAMDIEVTLSWKDPRGQRREESFRLDLLAA